MKNLALKVQRFLVSEDGPTAVEYAVMLALIIIVCLTAITIYRNQCQRDVHTVLPISLVGRAVVESFGPTWAEVTT